jgi:hypothetical protein
LKQSTDGLEGLADIAYNVEDAREDAAQKARAVWALSCGSWHGFEGIDVQCCRL